MHELSVTQSLLDLALKHSSKAGATRILSLNITIGNLASIVDDSVQFYWDILSKSTPAEGATLNFNRVPTKLLCLDCNHRYSPKPGELACPQCGSAHIHILSGKEFSLDSIDVER